MFKYNCLVIFYLLCGGKVQLASCLHLIKCKDIQHVLILRCLPSLPGLSLSLMLHHPRHFDMWLLETSQALQVFFFFFPHINSSLEISHFLLSMMRAFPGSGHVGRRAGVSEAQKTSHDQQSPESRGDVPGEQMPQPRGSLIVVKGDYSSLSSSCRCPRARTHVCTHGHTRKYTHAHTREFFLEAPVLLSPRPLSGRTLPVALPSSAPQTSLF